MQENGTGIKFSTRIRYYDADEEGEEIVIKNKKELKQYCLIEKFKQNVEKKENRIITEYSYVLRRNRQLEIDFAD